MLSPYDAWARRCTVRSARVPACPRLCPPYRYLIRLDALRTRSAGVDPGLDQLTQPLLGAGRGGATGPRFPRPADEIVVRQMLVQQREIAPAVALRVLDLAADLAHRLALPRHLDRRQAPARMPGHALAPRLLAGDKGIRAVNVAGAGGVAGPASGVGTESGLG